ncbi:MAG: hypothetical protein Q8P26_01145 [Candidatus Levybacteria bacterium]|nr:hypothetical protein [Candidatus Levybacteria bacterium]
MKEREKIRRHPNNPIARKRLRRNQIADIGAQIILDKVRREGVVIKSGGKSIRVY